MHPDEIELHHWIDGELDQGRNAAIGEHVLTCTACRTRADGLRADSRSVYASLSALDAPIPAIAFAQVRARAVSAGVPWRRVAAAVVITVSISGVAVAAARGPLLAWVASAARVFSARSAPARPVEAPAPPAGSPSIAGVAMRAGPSISVAFTNYQATGHLRIVMGDDSTLQVTAPAGAARFTSASGVLLVENTGATASFDVRIPRDAARVEIRVAERRVYLKIGPRVNSDVPADSDGITLVSLSAPGGLSQTRR